MLCGLHVLISFTCLKWTVLILFIPFLLVVSPLIDLICSRAFWSISSHCPVTLLLYSQTEVTCLCSYVSAWSTWEWPSTMVHYIHEYLNILWWQYFEGAKWHIFRQRKGFIDYEFHGQLKILKRTRSETMNLWPIGKLKKQELNILILKSAWRMYCGDLYSILWQTLVETICCIT